MRAGRVAVPAAGARGRPGSRRARSRGAGDGRGACTALPPSPPSTSGACALAVSCRPWDSAACEGRERRGRDGRRRGNRGGEGSGCPAVRHRGGPGNLEADTGGRPAAAEGPPRRPGEERRARGAPGAGRAQGGQRGARRRCGTRGAPWGVQRQDRSGLGRLWPVWRPGLCLSWVVRGQQRVEKRVQCAQPACVGLRLCWHVEIG